MQPLQLEDKGHIINAQFTQWKKIMLVKLFINHGVFH